MPSVLTTDPLAVPTDATVATPLVSILNFDTTQLEISGEFGTRTSRGFESRLSASRIARGARLVNRRSYGQTKVGATSLP